MKMEEKEKKERSCVAGILFCCLPLFFVMCWQGAGRSSESPRNCAILHSKLSCPLPRQQPPAHFSVISSVRAFSFFLSVSYEMIAESRKFYSRWISFSVRHPDGIVILAVKIFFIIHQL
ncbi:hypothetical protein [Phaffia rhodozyma]|uniref:Uncharacterized protein n=1 Tax=Phaffia rhodozyma TaxID=264483 RepID=A0A0F7SS60_PHARH|nr:hypothetical protein [Phaffia rhodozyma]